MKFFSRFLKDPNMKTTLSLILVVLVIIFLYLLYGRKQREGAGVAHRVTKTRAISLRTGKHRRQAIKRTGVTNTTGAEMQSSQQELDVPIPGVADAWDINRYVEQQRALRQLGLGRPTTGFQGLVDAKQLKKAMRAANMPIKPRVDAKDVKDDGGHVAVPNRDSENRPKQFTRDAVGLSWQPPPRIGGLAPSKQVRPVRGIEVSVGEAVAKAARIKQQTQPALRMRDGPAERMNKDRSREEWLRTQQPKVNSNPAANRITDYIPPGTSAAGRALRGGGYPKVPTSTTTGISRDYDGPGAPPTLLYPRPRTYSPSNTPLTPRGEGVDFAPDRVKGGLSAYNLRLRNQKGRSDEPDLGHYPQTAGGFSRYTADKKMWEDKQQVRKKGRELGLGPSLWDSSYDPNLSSR